MSEANYAVKDRNLVTSQHPFSGTAFNKLYLEALAEYLAWLETEALGRLGVQNSTSV